MSEETPTKSIVTERTVTTKTEGAHIGVDVTGTKHLLRWIIGACGLLLANFVHTVVQDFLPNKGAAEVQQVKETTAVNVRRNDEDNKDIKEKLTAILVMKNDQDTLKNDIRDLKTDMHDMNHRFDEFILSAKR